MEFVPESIPMLLAGVFVFGLLIGSFLNVLILRIPSSLEYEWRMQCTELVGKGKETNPPPPGIFFSRSLCPHCDDLPVLGYLLISGKCSECGERIPRKLEFARSNCQTCGHNIRAWENIPILSYLFLRGRCSKCGLRISIRYPLIELITALVFSITIWHFGPTVQGLAALFLSSTLIVLTGIDFDHQLLPDNLTIPLMWGGIALNFNSLFTDLNSSFLGAIVGYLVFWSVYHLFKQVRGKEGMGYGDFKLMAALGAWFGWQILPLTILLSSSIGALVGLVLMAGGKLGRDRPIPFGPFIAAAGWVAMIWGKQISDRIFGDNPFL